MTVMRVLISQNAPTAVEWCRQSVRFSENTGLALLSSFDSLPEPLNATFERKGGVTVARTSNEQGL